MEGLEAVISGAISEAESSGSVPADTTPVVETASEPDAAVEAGSTPEVPVDSTEAAPPAEAPAVPTPEKATPGPIPFVKHKQILENARTEAESKVRAEYEQKYAWANVPDARETMQAFQLAETNKPMFARVILGDPEYRQILTEMLGGAQGAPQSGAQGASQAPSDGKIEPDFQTEDGRGFYSADALQKLLAQQQAQLQQSFDQRFKQFEPIVQERQQREAFEAAKREHAPYVQNARDSWVGFKENESAIQAKFHENLFTKNYTLESAYREVMQPKWQADRDKMRQEILADLNKKPAAAIKAPSGPAPVSRGGRTLEDVIRESIATVPR